MVFTYICGNLQWSATGSSPDAAVVGYSSAGTQYLNHRLSGYRSIGDSISCAVRLGRRRKRQTGGNTLVFNVRNDVFERCQGMLGIDEGRGQNHLLPESRNRLEPCPCTVSQALQDTARFRQQSDDINCFVSMKPVVVATAGVHSSRESHIYQQCCYDEG